MYRRVVVFTGKCCDVRLVVPLQVNRTYIEITERMKRDPNAMRACLVTGLLASLNDLDAKLEKIQKSLDHVRTWRVSLPVYELNEIFAVFFRGVVTVCD